MDPYETQIECDAALDKQYALDVIRENPSKYDLPSARRALENLSGPFARGALFGKEAQQWHQDRAAMQAAATDAGGGDGEIRFDSGGSLDSMFDYSNYSNSQNNSPKKPAMKKKSKSATKNKSKKKKPKNYLEEYRRLEAEGIIKGGRRRTRKKRGRRRQKSRKKSGRKKNRTQKKRKKYNRRHRVRRRKYYLR